MSSLLDILQKKDGRTTSDVAAGAAASATNPMQSVELHLAVDNRGTVEEQAEEQGDTAQMVAGGFAIECEGGIAAEAAPTGAPAGLQIAAEAGPTDDAADATRSLLLDQRKLRVRRNTSLLIGSLVLILLAVTTAISIVLQYSADRSAEQSVIISPEAMQSASTQPAIISPEVMQSAPAQPVASKAPEQAVVRPLRKEVTSRQATTTQAVARDPDWYATPAIEPEDSITQIRITRGTTENPLFPKLSEAWNAFQSADYARAEALYREVQATDAANVDAMLGLAAIAMRSGLAQEAQALYNAVLEADPKNAAAIAALSTLPAGTPANGDTGNETRLKNLLREQPGAAELHFALGLQYVGNGRWPEAQQAFFEAVRNAPANADYAYNLAVSLDQLGQTSAAAAYYDRALSLVNGGALFDTAAARQRLTSLRAAAQ